MKYFTQLIIIGIVLWVSTKLFPNFIIIDDTKTLIIATVAYSVVNTFFAIIIVGTLLTLILNGQYITTIIIGCFATIIVSYISLVATEAYISGFQIIGTTPRLIVAIITAMATTRTTSEEAS